ncbi:hypothetical protein MGG_18107 [Pyricularia oryzae 70-15]|uniref:Uncharacterized protein n=1 Tax=Pyricularia oryzae (strain 70-15 / ATCC MYA-4617 / FGSC 8958) TaxID=242507 RepID=A0A151V4F6_PYRO7|nr:uncharacterized protein MGG_18107 [Pyricularia oryzae 70-15]KYQ30462.1 hypothetical protein MGG_18107 [Pyricularia oryzae 70-15]
MTEPSVESSEFSAVDQGSTQTDYNISNMDIIHCVGEQSPRSSVTPSLSSGMVKASVNSRNFIG